MSQHSLKAMGILILAALPASSITEEQSRADIILSCWADALGGRKALQRNSLTYVKSRYQGTAGSGVIEEWTSDQMQRRQHNRLDGGEELTVFDGTRGWERRNGRVRSLSPEENAGQKIAAYIGSLSHLLAGRPAS